MTENDLDAQLFRNKDCLAKTLGWSSYHTLRSKGSKSGYPDRTIWRDRVLFAELKSSDGKPTDLQRETLTQLTKAGAEAYLWTPADIDEVARILGGRWRLEAAVYDVPVLVGHSGGTATHWRPESLWTRDGGRVDGRFA